MDTSAAAPQQEGDLLRRQAEGSAPDDGLWPQERAALFADAAEHYRLAGQEGPAQQALWDAALWSSAIVERGERRQSGEFFNTLEFKGVLDTHLPDEGRDQDLQEEAQLALSYFDGQLEQQLPLGIRAAYADFLFATKSGFRTVMETGWIFVQRLRKWATNALDWLANPPSSRLIQGRKAFSQCGGPLIYLRAKSRLSQRGRVVSSSMLRQQSSPTCNLLKRS